MYVIHINKDNSLYGSCKEKIMQKEKMFNKLQFLVERYYNGFDMSKCTVLMRYMMPISNEYKTEILEMSNEEYEDHLMYILPIDTDLTKEHGDIELNLTFIMVDADTGEIIQRVRKTDSYMLHVTEIPDWDSVIPDSALSALDQRILKMDAQIKAINDMNAIVLDGKADNLSYDGEELWLMANGNKIGNAVKINSYDDSDVEDGLPVVDFSSSSGNDNDNPTMNEESNVVEF